MISIEEAKERQNLMQATAQSILDYYAIEPLLEQLGEVHKVGSYVYGLMVRPDIDFLIYSDSPTVKPLLEIANSVMLADGIGKVSIHNQYLWPSNASVTKSMYLGIKPVWENEFWQIDVHVMKPEDHVDQDNFYLNWEKELTEKQKDTILLLKTVLNDDGRYPHEFSSVEVYKAVLMGKVSTIKQLERWKISQSN
jgi:hypothetical protein